MRVVANGAGRRPGPRLLEPSLGATTCEAMLSRAMQ